MISAFDNMELKGVRLRNRFVRSATWEGMADKDGRVTDRLVGLLADLARGQVGLIITGFAYVSAHGQALPYQTGVHDDNMTPGLAKLAEAVHRENGRIAVQIVHAGIQAYPKIIDMDLPVGPSVIDLDGGKTRHRELSVPEIAAIVEDFGRAAGRVKEAGFDAVQLHGAHGYLLSQFLSPFFNRRGDRYGGSPQNRARILFEVYEAVRGAVGSDFPVMIKINTRDFIPGGLELEDSLKATLDLAAMGLDAVETSGGCKWSLDKKYPARLDLKSREDEAYFREDAAVFKEKLRIPVMLVGGLRSFETIEDVLEKKQADYLSLCRPLIREPNLIERWNEGDLRPPDCINCSRCMGTPISGKGLSCKELETDD
jgi:2,4-dienoyl-CoA reductase-like NADH-dependent reductase (Old Yellow Enzyme family)